MESARKKMRGREVQAIGRAAKAAMKKKRPFGPELLKILSESKERFRLFVASLLPRAVCLVRTSCVLRGLYILYLLLWLLRRQI